MRGVGWYTGELLLLFRSVEVSCRTAARTHDRNLGTHGAGRRTRRAGGHRGYGGHRDGIGRAVATGHMCANVGADFAKVVGAGRGKLSCGRVRTAVGRAHLLATL